MNTLQQVLTARPKSGKLADIEIHRDTPFSKKKVARMASADRITNATTKTAYDGKELRRNAGIPESRFKAFELPSLTHYGLVYPKVNK